LNCFIVTLTNGPYIYADGVIGIGLTAIAAGLVVGVIASKVLQHWPN